ncbi:BQ5605_C009g05510 [Microbotryum silenes-dioicae]|uniref:BQ5605_C009g05510 protein n=1 Tax=Microbotryum silenes-dioicae TaxID=796604 RepID=A0A2X0PET6_9BASI|nr:BQ5605_C009g05510 [Microbotryum silenes-dioicae]
MAPLLSFRAGRAFRQGETNTVVPAPGRGLITIEEEDGLMHFYWKDLDANAIVEDLIIFPGDATFVKASERVHVLKFSSSSARSFFWHQDVDASHDQERADKVNELIGAQIDEEEDSAGAMEVEPTTPRNPFQTPAPASRIAMPPPTTAQPVARTVPAPSFSSSSAANPRLGSEAQMAQLRNILAGITGETASGSSSGFGGMNEVPEYQLQDVLTPTVISSLLSNPSPALLAKLSPLLPPILPSNSSESLRRATTGTPEFRRSVAALDRALRTGALGPLVTGLGMAEEAAMGVESFLQEVQKQGEEEKKKEEGEDTEMKE